MTPTRLVATWRRVAALAFVSLSACGSPSRAAPLAASGPRRLSFLAAHGADKQPPRCNPGGVVDCVAFGASCPSDTECKTNKCYEGKCGMGPACKPYGQVCYKYAPHVCCTGECKGVELKADCLRLLKLDNSAAAHRGIIVDRQCEKIGYCSLWAGQKPPPGPQSTPWAVDLPDLVAKYYNLPGVTFTPDTHVLTDQYVARREGETIEGVMPDRTQPGTVRTAGIIYFDSGAYVETKFWNKFVAGVQVYCAAPILLDGVGGAFYAIGKDCCNKDEGFTCGDVDDNPTKGCAVIGREQPSYQYAVEAMDAKGDGEKFHGGGKGIDTPKPMFCRWVKDVEKEMAPREPEDTLYIFKPLMPTTYCVAAIANAEGLPKPQQYWAVGTNCCSRDGGFHCDDSEVAGAHSGEGDVDTTGQYIHTVMVGKLMYGWDTVKHPYFVHWKKDILVPPPGSDAHKPKIEYGEGVVGKTLR